MAQNFVLLDFSFRFFSRAAQVCRPYKGGRNLIPYPTRATARVAPTTFPHKYTERRTLRVEQSLPVRRRSRSQTGPSVHGLLSEIRREGQAPPLPSSRKFPSFGLAHLKQFCRPLEPGGPVCRPYKKRPQIHRRGRTLAGPPYPGTAGGASLSPAGFKKVFSVWVGKVLGAPARIRTGNVCSAKPGAVVEPHQRKFLQTQGPVARWEFRPATQILRAGNFVQPYRYASSVMGSGESGPMDLGGAKRSRSPSAASPAAFWLLCRRGQSNSPPAGGEIPPARNETALSSPPHPPQCAHWGTCPPGGRLMEKRR